MPLYVDDTSKPTGDIFTDQRRQAQNPSQSSTSGATYPRTSNQAGANFQSSQFGRTTNKPDSPYRQARSAYMNRARSSVTHNEPYQFSRTTDNTEFTNLSTGESRRYAGTVNIGAGNTRRTLGFRTTRDLQKAQRLVAERNTRVRAIREDATRRGISLKEAQDMNNQPRSKGLSFGEKILMNAGTRGLVSDEKRHKKTKRNMHDNALPRSKQRAMRKMVPPGTFEKKSASDDVEYVANQAKKIRRQASASGAGLGGVYGGVLGGAIGLAGGKRMGALAALGGAGAGAAAAHGLMAPARTKSKTQEELLRRRAAALRAEGKSLSFGGSILSKAGTRLESGEKDDKKRVGFWRAQGRTALEASPGAAAMTAGGALMARGKGKVGAALYAAGLGGGIAGAVHGFRKSVRNQQAEGRNLGKLHTAAMYPYSAGLRKGNPDAKFRPGAKSAETDSFGKTVMDQARASLPKE